jgi:hypothetical protein
MGQRLGAAQPNIRWSYRACRGENCILLFDNATRIVLMTREEEYQVYPAESAFGAIEVKSKLTKAELTKAFENIASYKQLRKVGGASDTERARLWHHFRCRNKEISRSCGEWFD